MARKKLKRSGTTRWAYAYELVPPQSADRLGLIRTLLEQEQATARREARAWGGTIVTEE